MSASTTGLGRAEKTYRPLSLDGCVTRAANGDLWFLGGGCVCGRHEEIGVRIRIKRPSWWPLAAVLLVVGYRLLGGWVTLAVLATAAGLVSLVYLTGNGDRVIYSVHPSVTSETPVPQPLSPPVIPGN